MDDTVLLKSRQPAGSSSNHLYMIVLRPFTSTISVMLYLVGMAVGLTTGVMVGFGQTVTSPARALLLGGGMSQAPTCHHHNVPNNNRGVAGTPALGHCRGTRKAVAGRPRRACGGQRAARRAALHRGGAGIRPAGSQAGPSPGPSRQVDRSFVHCLTVKTHTNVLVLHQQTAARTPSTRMHRCMQQL